jgi:hypothetical protein
MDIENLTLKQIREISAMCGSSSWQKVKNPNGRIEIVILDRGWIVVGKVDITGEEVTISNCAVVRYWGTTKGLGEIAENGPTEKTILDRAPTIRTALHAVIWRMDVSQEKWSSLCQ